MSISTDDSFLMVIPTEDSWLRNSSGMAWPWKRLLYPWALQRV